MATPIQRTTKRLLVEGAVKPWHVVFLILVSWVASIIGGTKATQHLDVGIRGEFQSIAMQAISSAIILAFTFVVPEFRRSLSILFVRPTSPPSTRDLTLTFALMLAWGYGLYRVAVVFPILLLYPDAYGKFLAVSIAPFEPKYLIYLVGAVLVAPAGEELVFRGYLLNLWMARLGVWPAVILSTLFFGALHWQNAIFAAALGFILALVYLRYDSLWPGILLHAGYNLLAFPWLLGGLNYVKQRESIGQISNWIPEAVTGVLFIPLFVFFWRRFKPASTS